jgi:hypothetical protein
MQASLKIWNSMGLFFVVWQIQFVVKKVLVKGTSKSTHQPFLL